MTFSDLVICTQGDNGKITDFIACYQVLLSQISYQLPDSDVQKVFIGNLQRSWQEKFSLMKYPSFAHLCAT